MTELALPRPPLAEPSLLAGFRGWRLAGVGASVALHLALAWAARGEHPRPSAPPRRTIAIESRPRPHPAPPPDDRPAERDAPPGATEPRAPNARPPVAGRALATAGKVMLAKGSSDDAPADFTMVTGAGTYAGGVTAADGTSRAPVDRGPGVAAPAVPSPAPLASAPAARRPAEDRSSRARVRGVDWGCSALFPASAQRDDAWVSVIVAVRADGTPEAVTVVSDPGEGFGAAARACALRQTFEPARDPDGAAIAGRTAPVRVHFTR